LTPLDPDLALPEARMSIRFRRTLSVLVGIAAVSATVLSWVEADNGRKEEQAFVNASRSALDIFVKIAASSPRSQFEGNALRRALAVQSEGGGGVLAVGVGSQIFDELLKQAKGDERAGDRLAQIAKQMAAVPDEFPALDPATLEAIQISNPAELQPLVEQQNAYTDDAIVVGTRQEHSFFSLGLVATAAALIGLAGLMGASRAGWISLFTSAAALTFALLWTAIAFL
jgi:nucleotide-binding universal stress UspA family protein